MSLRTLLTALVMTVSACAMAATEVVNLNNRTSADLLPVAQNFIGKDGTVSAYGNQLIVNAEPARIEGLRALLGQLDTPAKRLLITVDTNENNQQNSGDSRPASSATALPAATVACSRSRPAKACLR